MHVVDEEIQTIHLYVVKEEEKKPFVVLPLFGALMCLAAMISVIAYSALHPSYEHERLTIPAHFLPLQIFRTTQPIIPTGIKIYPAITAHGMLTITNGSVIAQIIPKGFIVNDVITDTSVFVPAGSADGYGYAVVPAHALVSGKGGNSPALTINQVVGSSVYIRNLSPFTGGRDSYSVKIVTRQDKQTALDSAKALLMPQKDHMQAILAKPCTESVSWSQAVHLTWTCQFVAYPTISGKKITAVHLVGKNLLVDVVFLPHPLRMAMR